MDNHLSIAPSPDFPPSPSDPSAGEISSEERQRIHASANWFFWIAALSLINSIAAHAGSTWNFILGLAVPQVVDALMSQMAGTPGVVLAIAFDVIIALVFVGIGFLARRFQYWAFVLGMIIYALDGLIFLAVGEYLGFGFHLFGLFSIFMGFRILHQHRQQTAVGPGA